MYIISEWNNPPAEPVVELIGDDWKVDLKPELSYKSRFKGDAICGN